MDQQIPHGEGPFLLVIVMLLLFLGGVVAGIVALCRRLMDRNADHVGAGPRRGGSAVLLGMSLVGLAVLILLAGAYTWRRSSIAFHEPHASRGEAVHEAIVYPTGVRGPTFIPVEHAPIAPGGPLPDWVHLAENRGGQVRSVVLVSRWSSSVAEADRDIVDAAISRTLAYLREIEPQRASWDVSAELVERHAFGRLHVEDRHVSRRPHEFRVYRELRLTPELASIVPSSPSTAPLPEWAKAERDAVDESDSRMLLLVSRQYATVDEAEQELLDQATNFVRERFHAVHPPAKGWDVPEESVRAMYGPRRHVEELERSSGEHTFRVHRVYRELRLPTDLTDVRGELYASWRQAVVERRLRRIGGGIAVATFTLFLASLGLRRTRRRSNDTPNESPRGGGKAIGVTTLAVIAVLASVAILHPAALLIGVMMLAVIVVLTLGFAVIA